jgi:hypothetical protein
MIEPQIAGRDKSSPAGMNHMKRSPVRSGDK